MFASSFPSLTCRSDKFFYHSRRPFATLRQHSNQGPQKALVRELSPQFAIGALRTHKALSIDLSLAKKQHQDYISALAQCNVHIIQIPAEDGCPDSSFVEDTAVVVDNRVLITNSAVKSRSKERLGVRNIFEELNYTVVNMDHPATMDGGDVLFTGKEFFVGLTSRTNKYGIEALSRAFPGYRVTAIPMNRFFPKKNSPKYHTFMSLASSSAERPLHLKSICSVAGPNAIAFANSQLGSAIANYMQDHSGVSKALRHSGKSLSFVPVGIPELSNVVYANGTLIMRDPEEFEVDRIQTPFLAEPGEELIQFAEFEGLNIAFVNMSEFAKADGALTCCSILC